MREWKFHIHLPDSVIEELVTDDSGLTPTIALPAPPVEYSMEPQDSQPYSEYNVKLPHQDMLICLYRVLKFFE